MTVEDFGAHKRAKNGFVPPRVVEADSFIGVPAPKRQYLDDSYLLPMFQVILFGGDGGTGKSLLLLQLALACSSVLPYWIGMSVMTGPVIYLTAEDNEAEIHKRIEEICEAEGADLERVRGCLSIIDMSDDVALLAVPKDKDGNLKTTDLYGWLDEFMKERKPLVLILDNLSDTYGGNENIRTSVKQFINLLRKLAAKHECVVILLAHPSQAGRNSGSGESGSTAWNNSVRVRLYLHDAPKDAEDEDARQLEVMKSNYSRKGRKIGLRRDNGRFVPDASAGVPSYLDGVPPRFFEQVQTAFRGMKYRTSSQTTEWGGYKIADMLGLDAGVGLTDKQRSDDIQKPAFNKVSKLLAAMVASKALKIVKAKDGHGDKRPYFEVGEGNND